jgi:hypothetical protein
MKKITTFFAVMLLASVALTSCDSKKSDAKKAADLFCKMQKLMKDPNAKTEDVEKLSKEFEEFQKKMKDKYKDASEKDNQYMDSLVEVYVKDCK